MFSTSLESFYMERTENYSGEFSVSLESFIDLGIESDYPDMDDDDYLSCGMEAVSNFAEAEQFGLMAYMSMENLNEMDDSDEISMEGFVEAMKKAWEFIKDAFKKIIAGISNFFKSVVNFFKGDSVKKETEDYQEAKKDPEFNEKVQETKKKGITIKKYPLKDTSGFAEASKKLQNISTSIGSTSQNAARLLDVNNFRNRVPEELSKMVLDIKKTDSNESPFNALYFKDNSVSAIIYGTKELIKKEVPVYEIVENADNLLSMSSLQDGKAISKNASQFGKSMSTIIKLIKQVEKNLGDNPKYTKHQKIALANFKDIQSVSTKIANEMRAYLNILLSERKICSKAIDIVMKGKQKAQDKSDKADREDEKKADKKAKK